jgi:hypothetical protein
MNAIYLPRAHRFSDKMTEEVYNVWTHTDPRFQFENFSGAIRYPYPDGRKRKRHVRESTEYYKMCGGIAKNHKAKDEKDYTEGRRKRPKKAKDYSYNGIHDITPVVEGTSFGYPNLGPDSMHYASNASNYLIKLYKGDRGLSDGSRAQSISQHKHPELMYTKIRAKWETDQYHQDLIDTVVNYILVPPEYKASYGIRHPFKLRSYLRAKDHMVFIMVFASYVLSFADIGEEYNTFAAMYAADLCKIFDPCLDLDVLRHTIIPEVYETRAVQEGLYPESEQVFIFHQLIDIVHHIENFGHVRGISSFAAERANGSITQCLSKGGVNYIETLIGRYVVKENLMTKHLRFKNHDEYDNTGTYSDFTMRVYSSRTKSLTPKDNLFDGYDLNYLFKTLYLFLRTQEIDNIMLGSPFFRLYVAYLFMSSQQGVNTSQGNRFYEWLVAFYTAYTLSLSEPVDSITTDVPRLYHDILYVTKGTKLKKHKQNNNNNNNNKKLLKTQYCTVLHRKTSNNNSTKTEITPQMNIIDPLLVVVGHVYESDVIDVIQCVQNKMNKKVQVHNRAIIKGVKFQCRGYEFADKKNETEINTKINDLTVNWSDRTHYSSWCRIRHYEPDESEISISTEIQFGQLNYCFRLNFPCDKYVHGLAFGHCSVRNSSTYAHDRWQYYVNARGGLGSLKANRFICLNYVDSTAIAVSALNSENQPLLSGANLNGFTSLAAITELENEKVDRIFLIPIHPERIEFTYRCIVPDLDNTRVLEKECNFD